MAGLLDVCPPVYCSLTPHLLLLLHYLTLWSGFVLHVDRIVRRTSVSFLAQFILASHAVELLILRAVLVLHELPAFYIAIHLLHPPRLNTLLPQLTLTFSLLSVVRGEVFVLSVERAGCKVRRLRVRVIQLGVVHELVVTSDVLPRSQIV